MKCPVCKAIFSDERDLCPRCLMDLRPKKKLMGIPITQSTSSYQTLLEAAQRREAPATKVKSLPARRQTNDLPVGTRYADRYLIEGVLGKGASATTYRARDRVRNNETVALKILHPEFSKEREAIAHFLSELHLCRKIQHPSVVKTFDGGVYEGLLYITLEFIDGRTLEDWIAEREFSINEATRLLYQISGGLHEIHSLGVVHRDLKPQNVLMTEAGVAKIGDFGVAQIGLAPSEDDTLLVGSAPYLAPEIWMGTATFAVGDLYALGVLTYEMLTGTLPFKGATHAEILLAHLQQPPPSPKKIRPDIPEWLDTLILKLLTKDPQERLQSASEITMICSNFSKNSRSELLESIV